eukprot:UC1_evm1s505
MPPPKPRWKEEMERRKQAELVEKLEEQKPSWIDQLVAEDRPQWKKDKEQRDALAAIKAGAAKRAEEEEDERRREAEANDPRVKPSWMKNLAKKNSRSSKDNPRAPKSGQDAPPPVKLY